MTCTSRGASSEPRGKRREQLAYARGYSDGLPVACRELEAALGGHSATPPRLRAVEDPTAAPRGRAA